MFCPSPRLAELAQRLLAAQQNLARAEAAGALPRRWRWPWRPRNTPDREAELMHTAFEAFVRYDAALIEEVSWLRRNSGELRVEDVSAGKPIIWDAITSSQAETITADARRVLLQQQKKPNGKP
jgi:hypothetical protein